MTTTYLELIDRGAPPVVFVDAVPKTAVGKVNRKALRDSLAWNDGRPRVH